MTTMTGLTDKQLKDRMNSALFTDEYCTKCGCHQTWHGWWIYDGLVRCSSCQTGIHMAQVDYFEWPASLRICYRDVWTLDDAAKAKGE